ncbi:hypothetical protein FRB99_007012 [Tulasnella sp. 403]|nr:hypothetical protein FRB99_007012 [Tulasnella sp. 403]
MRLPAGLHFRYITPVRSSSLTRRTASNLSGFVPPSTGSSDESDRAKPDPSEQSELLSSTTPPPGSSGTEGDVAEAQFTASESPQLSGVPARTTPDRPVDPLDHVIPFNTYRFYKALEISFEPPIAKTLMRATRGALVDRIRRTKKDALSVQNFDNSAYLFRAALSELRTELTMRTRKETATLRTTLTALRKEVDLLDSKMKEDIATLKHEIQMDINNRKTESKAETKRADLAIEGRTEIEQAKWDNTRRGVAVIGAFVMLVIVSMELAPKKPAPPPPPPPAPIMIERPLPNVRELESDDDSASGLASDTQPNSKS